MALQITPRIESIDPARFWRAAPPPGCWRDMVSKYAALASAAALASGPRDSDYKIALKAIARRWPAALREGELIGPARVDARHRAALSGLDRTGPRDSWTDEPGQAALCWAELHAQLRDLAAYRRSAAARPDSRMSSSFAAWLLEREPELTADGARSRWLLDDSGASSTSNGPTSNGATNNGATNWAASYLAAVVGPTIKVRSAYLSLAARAGLGLPDLHGLLFARAGHWDHRPDDPPWAHA